MAGVRYAFINFYASMVLEIKKQVSLHHVDSI